MSAAVVSRLHQDFTALAEHLKVQAEASLLSTAEETFRKALLMAAASHFEACITETILDVCREVSYPTTPIPELVKNKALSRQYHTLFDWDANNVNRFFGLFGDGFKAYMQSILKEDPSLARAIRSFVEVGRERNRLVHTDYGSFTLEKTAEEIYALFEDATRFVGALRGLLDAYVETELAHRDPPPEVLSVLGLPESWRHLKRRS